MLSSCGLLPFPFLVKALATEYFTRLQYISSTAFALQLISIVNIRQYLKIQSNVINMATNYNLIFSATTIVYSF